jgi:amidase
VRRKEVKPIELVDAAIERIERLNPGQRGHNSMYDEGRRGLGPAGRPSPASLCPMTWVEYATRLTEGSALLATTLDHDMSSARPRKPACHPGKTNTPEFAPDHPNQLFGPTRNP